MRGSPGRVLVLELNEITWDLMDPMLQRGLLPNFQALIRGGVRGEPWANEAPGQLDPWVTWTTVYTGVPQSVHRLKMLEQDRETLGALRLWEYLREAGLRLGLFGSANSWPPQPVDGFWIPGPFSRDDTTYPRELQPIQELNIGLTRGHTVRESPKPPLWKLAPQIIRLGLSVPTMVRLAREMVAMKANPVLRWRMAGLQPVVNIDLFSRLYRKYQPHFATFHSNHVAYYMHRYWRAMDPSAFEVPPSREEVETYGGCIEFGYRIADEILGRLRRLAGPEVNLVVLSSCGQQPATGGRYSEDQRAGHVGVQIKMKALLEVLGIADQVRYSNLMAPQWKVDFDDPALLERTVQILENSRNLTRNSPVFGISVEGRSVCLGGRREQKLDDTIQIALPQGPRQFRLGELFDTHTPVPKSGYHHPKGVLVMHGPAVRPGVNVGRCDNLDLAPTLMRLLNQPVPAMMQGRVLEEALAEPRVPVAA